MTDHGVLDPDEREEIQDLVRGLDDFMRKRQMEKREREVRG